MGQPAAGDCGIHRWWKLTRGTETSQYPEEKKTKVIAQVVASERATAQTGTVTAVPGLKDRQQGRWIVSRSGWKAAPERVKVP